MSHDVLTSPGAAAFSLFCGLRSGSEEKIFFVIL
jgi:hypothetical protein